MAISELTKTLIDFLVCPVCHQSLAAGPAGDAFAWLRCNGCGRHFPVEDGIPVMLEHRATLQPPPAENR